MGLDNPYAATQTPLDPSLAPPSPAVWSWYIVYCVAMALLYLLVVALGVAFLFLPPDEGMSQTEMNIMAVAFIGVGLVLAVPYGAAPFLPKRPWVWVLGIVLIGIGLTSCLTLPAALPLMLFWIKPEAQRFFGKAV